MSKRSRDGDVIIQRPQVPPVHNGNMPYQMAQLVGTKRSARFGEYQDTKRGRFSLDLPHEEIPEIESHKRSSEFDIELNRLHKRMKATTPTAEQVMAYLIPHLVNLRKMYLSEQSKAAKMSTKVKALEENNAAITRAFREQLTKNHLIARQLENAHYRLVLAAPSVCNASLQ